MEEKAIANEVISSLKIAPFIRNIHIEQTDCPWKERAFFKRKKDSFEVKVDVWKDSLFLYGRIYRLFLYLYDVLNDDFQYRPEMAPDKRIDPKLKSRHDQIWSIYVDSRLEKRGIDSFYDKATRGNVFVDAEKGLSWAKARAIFQELWDKDSFTYPEIADYAYNLGRLSEKDALCTNEINEVYINDLLLNSHQQKHLESIPSAWLRDSVNNVLKFIKYNCRDIQLETPYYGISFHFQKRVFLEMIPTPENELFLTLFDAASNTYKTRLFTEDSSVTDIQGLIKGKYGNVSTHAHFYNQ